MTSPVYGFPFPTLGDVPNVPADLQALAEAVDAELSRVEVGQAAAYSIYKRPGTDSFPGGSMVSLGMNATIGGAPAGVYLVSWTVLLNAAAPRSGNLRIQVGSTIVNADGKTDLDTEVRAVSGAVPHLWAGGTISATASFQASGTATVNAGSLLSVVRIGDAP